MMWVKMKKRLKNNAGFSLAELMVAVAVTGLLMAGVFGVLSTSILSFQNTADQGANVQISRSVINAITEEIRNATAVSVPEFVKGTASTSLTLEYTFPNADTPHRRIALISNNVVITNSDDDSVIQSFGQGRVNAISPNTTPPLSFVRDKDSQRVFTVNLILLNTSYDKAYETPISTVITTMNLEP